MIVGLPVLNDAPRKPKWGDDCNGCGHCCAAELCAIGKKVYGESHPTPCPGLLFRDGRFWCQAVLIADSIDADHGTSIRLILGVGRGCDASDGE